jgi:hypothetical protein
MKKLKLIGLFIGLLLFGRNGFAQSPMNYAEYYWDTDPGYGLGTSLGAINTTNLNLTANVSTTGLLVGNHNLNVRVRDANGIWSQLLTKVIMVAPEAYNPGTNAQDIRGMPKRPSKQRFRGLLILNLSKQFLRLHWAKVAIFYPSE